MLLCMVYMVNNEKIHNLEVHKKRKLTACNQALTRFLLERKLFCTDNDFFISNKIKVLTCMWLNDFFQHEKLTELNVPTILDFVIEQDCE